MQGFGAGSHQRTAYLAQYIPAETEVYSAVTYDSRCLGPAMTVSLAGGEYLDHQDHGAPMDMRIPVDECTGLTRPKE
jgi:hypothetical protein